MIFTRFVVLVPLIILSLLAGGILLIGSDPEAQAAGKIYYVAKTR